jgi:endonuclease/exonuclease/phosphatase family metal-dependent hydrolase
MQFITGSVLTSVKVMTYNIHHCNPPSKPDVIDMDAIVNVIRSADPDLVALQEVDVNTERSGAYDQAAEIAARLGMHHYFAKAIDYQGGYYGVAILSRYRLINPRTYALPLPDGGEGRVMAMASLKLPDSTSIMFASTHLDAQSNSANRLAQAERIVEIAENDNLPLIIGGDFNAVPDSDEIAIIDAFFEKTCRLCPPTIPVTTPTRAIDFIFYSHPENRFDVDTHTVIDDRYASDHRPVVAVIDLVK